MTWSIVRSLNMYLATPHVSTQREINGIPIKDVQRFPFLITIAPICDKMVHLASEGMIKIA